MVREGSTFFTIGDPLPLMAEMTDAAVLIPLARDRIVFTVRARGLPSHAGHVSFPGGKQESSDQSLRDTALREANEEINLTRSSVDVIQDLPIHETRTSGYRIKPYVGRVPPGTVFEPNAEVDEIFTVPIDTLNDHRVRADDDIRYPCGEYTIWGATARILCTFLETRPTGRT